MTALPGSFPCTGVGSLPHPSIPAPPWPWSCPGSGKSRAGPSFPRRTPLEHHVPAIRRGPPRGFGRRGSPDDEERGGPPSGRGDVLRDVPLRRPLPLRRPGGAGGRAARAARGRRRPLPRGERPGDRARFLRAHGLRPGEEAVLVQAVGRDVLVKYLLRVAQWQAERLRRLSGTVSILTLDEPYLASVGSAIVSLPREEVIAALDEIFDGLPGVLCGIHCCANTDWGLVLASKVGYLSFDAYEYADSLLLYPEEVSAFLARGGVLAFGVIPTSREAIAAETPESLAGRMEGILDRYASRGISREAMVRASVITPACGLGTLPEESAERALRLTVELSALLRTRYGAASP